MDPDREQLERHIAEVKRSLAARLDELGGRVNKARRVLELRNHVRENVGLSLGVATAVGFFFGQRRRRLSGHVEVVHPRGVLGSVAESLLRSLVVVAAQAAFRMIQGERENGAPHASFGSHRTSPERERPMS